jgi:hypothetical protein
MEDSVLFARNRVAKGLLAQIHPQDILRSWGDIRFLM